MLFTNFKRILKSGYLGFKRNGWLSAASVLVMSLCLIVLGNLIFLSALAGNLLASFEKKIDISVYFHADAAEEKVISIKQDLEALPDVDQVTYVSREKALDDFRSQHKSDALVLSALEELGDNPLEASLNIRAKDPNNYAAISDFLVKKNYPSVDKINYFENQVVIERLSAILGTVRGSGAMLAAILAFIAVLVAFNTIRLAIYTMREEIGIMRLVGATQWFIRGPFLVSGLIYGVISAALTTLIFFPLLWIISPKLSVLLPDFNLFSYFIANFMEFLGIMTASGVMLGVLSSFIAIRRYLRI